jgi:hypothetical protein
MKLRNIEKKMRVSWKDTIQQIQKGEKAKVEIQAEDVNRVRVAASELNREGANYSISVSGNMILIMHE